MVHIALHNIFMQASQTAWEKRLPSKENCGSFSIIDRHCSARGYSGVVSRRDNSTELIAASPFKSPTRAIVIFHQCAQILMVRSLLPEATADPSGDQSRAYTSSACPGRVALALRYRCIRTVARVDSLHADTRDGKQTGEHAYARPYSSHGTNQMAFR